VSLKAQKVRYPRSRSSVQSANSSQNAKRPSSAKRKTSSLSSYTNSEVPSPIKNLSTAHRSLARRSTLRDSLGGSWSLRFIGYREHTQRDREMHASAKRPISVGHVAIVLLRALRMGKRVHEAPPVQTPGKAHSLGIIYYDLGHEHDQELGELEIGHCHEEASA
jgi:hypothetical protein